MARVYPVLLDLDLRAGRISFTGIDGQPYALETSTNLLSWATLTTGTPENGRIVFTGLPVTTSKFAFYRLRDLGTRVSARGRVVALPSFSPVAGAVLKLKVYDWATEQTRSFSGVSSLTGDFLILTDAEWLDWDGYYELQVSAPGYPAVTYRGFKPTFYRKDCLRREPSPERRL